MVGMWPGIRRSPQAQSLSKGGHRSPASSYVAARESRKIRVRDFLVKSKSGEAGGDEDSLNYSVPGFNGLSTEDETYRWDYFVRHYTNETQQRRDPKFVEKASDVIIASAKAQ